MKSGQTSAPLTALLPYQLLGSARRVPYHHLVLVGQDHFHSALSIILGYLSISTDQDWQNCDTNCSFQWASLNSTSTSTLVTSTHGIQTNVNPQSAQTSWWNSSGMGWWTSTPHAMPRCRWSWPDNPWLVTAQDSIVAGERVECWLAFCTCSGRRGCSTNLRCSMRNLHSRIFEYVRCHSNHISPLRHGKGDCWAWMKDETRFWRIRSSSLGNFGENHNARVIWHASPFARPCVGCISPSRSMCYRCQLKWELSCAQALFQDFFIVYADNSRFPIL